VLYLYGNQIVNVEPLQSLTNLTKLNITENPIQGNIPPSIQALLEHDDGGSVYGDEEDVDGALLLITDNDLRIQIQEQNLEAYSFAASNLSFSDRVTALKVHRLVHNSQSAEHLPTNPFGYEHPIRRSHVVQDVVSFLKTSRVKNTGTYDQKKRHPLHRWPLKIKFTHEDATDEGGPSKELLNITFKQFLRGSTKTTEFEDDHEEMDGEQKNDLRIFKMTKSKVSFQPDPAAVINRPEETSRHDAYVAAGKCTFIILH
jgi:hypothetical protein